MKHALIGVAWGLLIVVGSYLIVYVPAARQDGYRLFSRRRWRAIWSRQAECVGGPMDGECFDVTPRQMLGLALRDWPDVLYDAATRTYTLGAYMRGEHDPRRTWAGYYKLRFLSDRFTWHPTDLERHADWLYANDAESTP